MRSWLFLLPCLLLLACPADDDDDSATPSDDDAADDDAGDDDTVPFDPPAGECAMADKVGSFEVQHEVDYSLVYGQVADGVVPTTILENMGEMGGCKLLRRNNPFCDPPCEADFTCDHDGECIPYPVNQDVGTVTLHGLVQDVAMEPSSFNDYYDTTLTHPAFEPGAEITVVASGADHAGFTMHGEGVTPMETGDEVWVLREGEPLDISWVTAEQLYASIHMRFNVDQHGNSPVELVCDMEDTGSAQIPPELTGSLIQYGVTGFPSGNLYRRTVDRVQGEYGCVEFEVFSHVQGNLQVEGYIPCDDPTDCPDGMECNYATGTCV